MTNVNEAAGLKIPTQADVAAAMQDDPHAPGPIAGQPGSGTYARLYYDTETSGLPKDGLPADHPLQARLVQLAAKLVAANGDVLGCMNLYVKPDGWVMPPETTAKNGITHETLDRYGLPIKLVMATFNHLRAMADEELAHNIAFDDKIIRNELYRLGGSSLRLPDKRTCTMTRAKPIVNLPPTARMLAAGRRHPKPPSLTECHIHFFGCTFGGAHDAMNDVDAMIRVDTHILTTGGTPFPDVEVRQRVMEEYKAGRESKL